MTARAMWKGVIAFEDVAVPVKLYAALEDRSVHFRLLHKTDSAPVRQVMVNPDTEEIVPSDQTYRAYHTGEGAQVLLTKEDLDSVKPQPSRQIEVLKFLPEHVIDHRWYNRPYYLGPDGADQNYAALVAALASTQREGLTHWVMRNKEYYGALRVHQGYLLMITLRYEEQVVSAADLEPPKGKPLDHRELAMAQQLIEMLDAEFAPETFQNEYRERVLELIETKLQ
ncbi:MAG: Ku protein, partial [Natronospirillum sp.]